MRLVIGADHAGFALKEKLRKQLQAAGHEIVDVGAYEYNRDDDYPDFAAAVGRAVVAGEGERGILVCGSGVGACIAANKIDGVRCVVCSQPYSAALSRAHNDTNVLSMGARVVGTDLAKMIVKAWLEGEYEGGRHARRVEQIAQLEGGASL